MSGARDTGMGLNRVQSCDPVLKTLADGRHGAVAETHSVGTIIPFPLSLMSFRDHDRSVPDYSVSFSLSQSGSPQKKEREPVPMMCNLQAADGHLISVPVHT